MIKQFQGPYRWLSNFAPCPIEYEGLVYPTVEHAYQASKTCDALQRKALLLLSPAGAKRKGKTFRLTPQWDLLKYDIMKQLLRLKFHNPTFLARLKSTGDEVLQEGNLWGDTEWGVDLITGDGRNMLGKLIMEVRDELQADETHKKLITYGLLGSYFNRFRGGH